MNLQYERVTNSVGATTEAPPAAVPASESRASAAPVSLAARLAPYALALFFAVWGLRAVTAGNVVDTDAARHAMNGIFIHDFIRDVARGAAPFDPIEYGKQYYARLPALTLPFHPPLFPAIEAVFYFLLGVNLLAARLAVAVAVAFSVLLFYRLVVATHRSHALAIASTLTFFSCMLSRHLASDPMLEFPALVFTLGALCCLRDLQAGYSWRRALAFAVLAGAAVWSKQQTVFLGAAPFAYVVFARRWRLLAGKPIWISAAVFAVIVYALTLASGPFGRAATSEIPPGREMADVIYGNLRYYVQGFREEMGTLPAALVGLAALVSLFAPRRRAEAAGNDLYLAWTVASLGVLLVMGPYSNRYLFFTYPALAVIGYSVLIRLCSLFLAPARAAWLPVGIALLLFASRLNAPPTFLRGPEEAARIVVDAQATRVLYAGHTDGSFIFALRCLQPERRTVVIRGDKIPRSTWAAAESFSDFAARYGIQYVILERTKVPYAWDQLRAAPPAAMLLEREISLVNSQPTWNGDLRVYRLPTPPAASPERKLEVPVPRIGQRVEVGF